MVSRLAAFFRRLLPSIDELGPLCVASAAAFGVAAWVREHVARSIDTHVTPAEAWMVDVGDVQFWCGWALGCAAAVRWAPARVRRALAFLAHLLTGLVLALVVLELLFVRITGGRVDWEVLGFLFEDPSSVLILAGAEATGAHVAGAAGLLAVTVLPWFWRPRSDHWAWRLAIPALLYPLVSWGVWGRPTLRRPLRDLQPSLAEQLVYDGIERLGDERRPPTPAEVVPLAVEPRGERTRPNVVLVILESVGAGGTSLHVPALDTTPHLARLADEGVWAREMTAVVPHTSKALVTMLCGDWPMLTRSIREARPGGLPGRCLPELLEELGYRTAFFQPVVETYEDRVDLVKQLGFDRFRARDSLDGTRFSIVNYFGWEDRVMLKPGLRWATEDRLRPHFSVYLTLTSHHDYKVPPSFPSRAYPGQPGLRGSWLNAIRYVDAFLGELIERYEEAGLLDDTVFVVVGDHGEAFGEHGFNLHDLVMYEEGLHVPFVIWGPPLGERRGVIEGARQQIDILPTVLELVGAEVVGGTPRGRSLFEAPDADRVLYHSAWRSHRAMARRAGGAKLIERFRSGPPVYHRLADDPKERRNVVDALDPAQVEAWRQELADWRSWVNGRYDEQRLRWIAAHQRPDDAPALASWDGAMDLLGCAPAEPTAVGGQSVWFDCRWRARTSLPNAWRLAVRAEGAFGTVEDVWNPRMGDWPTWKWPAGWSVDDSFRITLPTLARPGPVQVSVRWVRRGRPLVADDGSEWVPVGTLELGPK